ncbi:fatty acid synthase-like [Plectropomus leopardus]|uniref:fatty acid synthase-like n=1 Tax=Plectropomus leopardus TaxID=160734 RepID=UPI001C4CB517|nr:fatty acid synthase-like [Plectropomus leopardus]
MQVLLSLEQGLWAPNLHFKCPNPDIPALIDGRVQVVDRPIPIRGGIVGINSFGFGGSNVHVILRPAEKHSDTNASPRMVPRVLQACGRTEAAVRAVLQKGKKHSSDENFLSLLNEVSGVPTASMPYRGYALIGSPSDVLEVQQVQATARPLWYICSGEPSNK